MSCSPPVMREDGSIDPVSVVVTESQGYQPVANRRRPLETVFQVVSFIDNDEVEDRNSTADGTCIVFLETLFASKIKQISVDPRQQISQSIPSFLPLFGVFRQAEAKTC